MEDKIENKVIDVFTKSGNRKYNIELDIKNIRSILLDLKHKISGMEEKEFSDHVLSLWNLGLFRYVSITEVVEFINHYFQNDFGLAFNFIDNLLKQNKIDEHEKMLAYMLLFFYLTTIYEIRFIQDPSIPENIRKKVIWFHSMIYHCDSSSYNKYYKIIFDEPCSYERDIIHRVRRFATEYFSLPVIYYDSKKRIKHGTTKLIIDPEFQKLISQESSSVISTEPGIDIFDSTYGVNYRKAIELMINNGIILKDYYLIGPPYYSKTGKRSSILFNTRRWYSPEEEGIRPSTSIITYTRDNHITLDILYNLCANGVFQKPVGAKTSNLSSYITKFVYPIISTVEDIVIKKERKGDCWFLYNTKTDTRYVKIPMILFFPLVLQNRQINDWGIKSC